MNLSEPPATVNIFRLYPRADLSKIPIIYYFLFLSLSFFLFFFLPFLFSFFLFVHFFLLLFSFPPSDQQPRFSTVGGVGNPPIPPVNVSTHTFLFELFLSLCFELVGCYIIRNSRFYCFLLSLIQKHPLRNSSMRTDKSCQVHCPFRIWIFYGIIRCDFCKLSFLFDVRYNHIMPVWEFLSLQKLRIS